MKNNTNRKWNAPVICFLVFTFIMIGLFIQFCYLGLSKDVYGIDMQSFASNRNTVSSTIVANRGTIYDAHSNILAQNISTYTLIAYLDSSRTKDESNPKHVVDKEYTASKLSSILGEENYDYILERLNKKSKQVEFGLVGKNLTELQKIAIEELNLPGIDFTETTKRYYPNGNFASYVIGYAKQYTRVNIKVDEEYDLYEDYKMYFDTYSNIKISITDKDVIELKDKTIKGLKVGNSIVYIKYNGRSLSTIVFNVTKRDNFDKIDNTIVGELGIEAIFDESLTGSDGYTSYQQDKYGYKIPKTPEVKIDAVDGNDIYLTIDSNIQRFAENAMTEVTQEYDPEWAIITVMDAKNGEILASATAPSYNPNSIPSDMQYQNPLVSYAYEPGSVMKIYTYMCAIETGTYNGKKTFYSGEYTFSDGTVVHDWDPYGWGYLTYDDGLKYSSNVGIINIIKDNLSRDKLKDCFNKYGFGKKTGVELASELSGDTNFKYDIEVATAGFGQGISTTPVQQLQALSIVANDGYMVKPHIIKKVVNPNTKEETVTKIVKSNKLVSSTTIKKIRDLMETVIQPDSPTGSRYYIEGFDIIGKTGTAQIYQNGKYLTGETDYIVSIALMYPKDDPEIIVYAAAKRPTHSIGNTFPEATKELVENIAKYRNMFDSSKFDENSNIVMIDNYVSENTKEIEKKLDELNVESVIIGNGDSIIKQYPTKGNKVIEDDKVFLLTNSNEYAMIDLSGYSRIDVIEFCKLVGLNPKFEGYGYVTEQSIEKGELIKKNSNISITLSSN